MAKNAAITSINRRLFCLFVTSKLMSLTPDLSLYICERVPAQIYRQQIAFLKGFQDDRRASVDDVVDRLDLLSQQSTERFGVGGANLYIKTVVTRNFVH